MAMDGADIFQPGDENLNDVIQDDAEVRGGSTPDTPVDTDAACAKDSSRDIQMTDGKDSSRDIQTTDGKVSSRDIQTTDGKESPRRAEGFIYLEDFSDYHLPTAPVEVNQPSPAGLEAFDSVIVDFMRDQSIPGASLCLAKDGEILYTQTYGWATHGVRVLPNHLFRIASVTKALTAVGVMTLVQDERLYLNQRVFGPRGVLNHFCPSSRGDRRLLRITVRHLLQHSAGWDREQVGDPVFWKHVGEEMSEPEPVSQNTLIAFMMTQKLQFTPGSKHVYSNLGYEVLGRIIEKVTGQPYQEFMKRLLLDIGLTSMELGRTKKVDGSKNEVEYFASSRMQQLVDSIYAEDGKVPAPYGGFAMETGDADGGWISTATDLVKFFNIIEGKGLHKVITPAIFKHMIAKPPYAKGSAWYGFGLEVSWYRKAWEHSGTLDGATSCLVHDRHGYTWAFLCNFWPPDSDYTSLISYALTKVGHWSRVKQVTLTPAEVTTLDKKYCVNLKVPFHDYTALEQTYKDLNYRPCWISGYEFQKKTFFNVIWAKDAAYDIHYCLDRANLDALLTHSKDTQQVSHIDTYLYKGVLKYAVILTQNHRKSVLKHFLSLSDLEDTTKSLKEEGYIATRQLVTVCDSELHLTALYEHSPEDTCWSYMELNSQKYQSEFNRHSRFGHLISYVKPYRTSDGPRFSTLWKSTGAYIYTSEYEMSKCRLLNDLLYAFERRFYPVCISGYEDEDAHKFVAICLKKVAPNSVK